MGADGEDCFTELHFGPIGLTLGFDLLLYESVEGVRLLAVTIWSLKALGTCWCYVNPNAVADELPNCFGFSV